MPQECARSGCRWIAATRTSLSRSTAGSTASAARVTCARSILTAGRPVSVALGCCLGGTNDDCVSGCSRPSSTLVPPRDNDDGKALRPTDDGRARGMHAVNQLPRFGPNPALLWSARTKRLWGCKIRIDIYIVTFGHRFLEERRTRQDYDATFATSHLRRGTSVEAEAPRATSPTMCVLPHPPSGPASPRLTN